MLKFFAQTLYIYVALSCLIPAILCAQSESGANQKLSFEPVDLISHTKSASVENITFDSSADLKSKQPKTQSAAQLQKRVQKIADNLKPAASDLSASPPLPTVKPQIDPTTDETATEPQTEKQDRALSARQTNPPDPNSASNSELRSVSPTSTFSLLQTLTALGVVIFLIFALKWVYAKLTGQVSTQNTQIVQVLARTAIAPRNHIVILRVGSRIIICSDSTHGTRTLSEITDPEEVAQMLAETSAAKDNSITKSFNNMLGKYGAAYDQKGRHPDEGLDTVEFQSDSARESVSKLLTRVRDIAGKGGQS